MNQLTKKPPLAEGVIIQIAEVAIAQAAALGQEIERDALIAELIALFDAKIAAAIPDDERDQLPPWRRFPAAFSSRFNFVEAVVETSETSSYYAGIPLDAPLDTAKRKVSILANSYCNYPKD